MSTETHGGAGFYPQPKLRIQGSYHAGTAGDTVPAGQPESVEIEVNEPFGEGGQAVSFITSLVDSLFRAAPRHHWSISNPDVDAPATDAITRRALGSEVSA
jgi:hypothetical protein